jgi:putative peptidoglycan lipid II flippase
MTTENGPKKGPNGPEEAQNGDPPVVSGRRLIQSTSIVSGMTLLSRILGLARDMVFARFFATSLVMDAFLVANRIPNMLRRFFAEGAFAQGFVPVMAQYREKHNHAETREFVDAVAGTFGLILFGITLLGVIAAPVLVAIVAPGFIGDDGRFELATMMLRFTFPYLLFVSLTAFAGGILNTYGRFAVPAFTPVILNVVLIAAAIWWAPALEEPGMALAYGVFVAGVLQLLFQIPFLIRIRAMPRPKWRIAHSGVRRVMTLMLSFGCTPRHDPDAARDFWILGRPDQPAGRRHHRVDARCRQNQFVVLLGSLNGVPAGTVRHRACHGDVAIPLSTIRERISR